MDELWRVGEFDGPEHRVLGQVGGAAFIGDDLVVSDGQSNRIHWYGGAGRHLNSAGSRGRGPGEFVEVRGLDVFSDGTVAAVNIGGGTVEVFGRDGTFLERLTLPGSPQEICAIDSALVVLGVLGGSDAPLHVFSLHDQGNLGSFGKTDVPETASPHRARLVDGLIGGAIECVEGTVVYARSSDGSVTALGLDGSTRWSTQIPHFVPMVHEADGKRGVRHGPAKGASEMHGFAGIWRLDETLAAQVWRVDIRADEVTLYTVFIDLATGEVLGKDDLLPRIIAATDDRIAVVQEASVPTVVVYSARSKDPPNRVLSARMREIGGGGVAF